MEDLGLIGEVEGELVGVDPAEINGGGDQIESNKKNPVWAWYGAEGEG